MLNFSFVCLCGGFALICVIFVSPFSPFEVFVVVLRLCNPLVSFCILVFVLCVFSSPTSLCVSPSLFCVSLWSFSLQPCFICFMLLSRTFHIPLCLLCLLFHWLTSLWSVCLHFWSFESLFCYFYFSVCVHLTLQEEISLNAKALRLGLWPVDLGSNSSMSVLMSGLGKLCELIRNKTCIY